MLCFCEYGFEEDVMSLMEKGFDVFINYLILYECYLIVFYVIII